MLNEEPRLPPEPPQLPRGKLWTTLLLPPLLTGGLNSMIGVLGRSADDRGIALSLILLPVALLFIIWGLVGFLGALRVRYRGSSVVLSGFGYFIGQVVICFTVWFGTCLVAFPDMRS